MSESKFVSAKTVVVALALLFFPIHSFSISSKLPSGFVYLDEVVPSIKVNLRYAGKHNILGHEFSGYEGNRAIVTDEAARALQVVQEVLEEDGLSLVVYDSYRPKSAVENLVEACKDNPVTHPIYHPDILASEAVEKGLIEKESDHCKGSTVDVSIISLDAEPHDPVLWLRVLADGVTMVPYLDDGTVDMGTSFDFLDHASHGDSPLVSEVHRKRREYLRWVMERFGFKAMAEEWWHFTLVDQPFPEAQFDFPVF